MSTVRFEMENGGTVAIDALPGENLLDIARRANVAIDAPCSGNGGCGKCKVRLLKGQVESLRSRHITPAEWDRGWRLSCCSKILGDVSVLVPDIASAYRSRLKIADFSSRREMEIFRKLRQDLMDAGIRFENGFRRLELRMEQPTLEDTLPDNERLTKAIREATGAETVRLSFMVLKKLSRVLRENAFQVCALGELDGKTYRCMELRGPGKSRMAGCAIDIGTTTVTMALIDLEDGRILAKGSSGNGQIRYGADVINRIVEQGKPGGIGKLQSAILEETLNPLLRSLCEQTSLPPENILRMTVGANTTMNHLLLGLDAGSIRMEPYIPSFFRWEGLRAGDLGLAANPRARVSLAPNIGSYVGGDITAGTLASLIWNKDEMSLFIDLGTNGEIVFGGKEFLMSCACSAGPAFEGGEISCGMRATDGAVEACRIDRETMEPELKVIGNPLQRPVGVCGSGIIDLIAELFRCGIINARGQFVREGSRICRDEHGSARYVLARADASATGREISLSEIDINSFIRAKGAIFSAVDTLLRAVDMTVDDIDRVYVAGGIGSGINMKNAVRIGMFPELPPEKFSYIGNSSLTGAYAMTVSDEAERRCQEIAANMTYVELSTCPGYMDSFVAACFLPHTDAKLFPGVLEELQHGD